MTTTSASGRTFEPDQNSDPWKGFTWTKKDAQGRTHEPIHKESRPSLGAQEPARRITRKQRDGWLRAFDKQAKAARPAGVRRGAEGTFSHAARSVLAYFLDLAVSTGRIFPSREHIAAVLDLPTSLLDRILNQLRGGGWLSWVRRFRPSRTAGQAGPQLEQDTNFYSVHLPLAAARLLAAWQRKAVEEEAAPPPAADRAARDRARARETLGRHRRGCEQNLRRVLEFMATAADSYARRKLEASARQLEGDIAECLRREALLSENNTLRRAEEAARLRGERESRKGSESSFGEKLTK